LGVLKDRYIYVVVCLGLLFIRMPDRFLNAQFYAEDGYLYEQAIRFGYHSIFASYAGYLLLIQRLIAYAASYLNPSYVPLFFNCMAMAAVGLVCARILSKRVNLALKPWLALNFVLWPHTEDIFVCMENMMWVVSILLLILLVTEAPDQKYSILLDSTVVFLAGLTGVFSILFLPLFILRAFLKRSSYSYIIASLVFFTALVQIYFVIHSYKQDFTLTIPWHDMWYIPAIIGYQSLAHLFFGNAVDLIHYPMLTLLGFITVVLIIYLLMTSVGNKQEFYTKALILAAMLITAAASLFRLKHSLSVLITEEQLGRYFFIAQVCFIWLLAFEYKKAEFSKHIAIACFSLFILTSAAYFKVKPLKDLHWKVYSKHVVKGAYYDIPINPEGWHFRSENSGL
jgi:hypothetical protein